MLSRSKRPKYSFGDANADRLLNYLDVFDKFFEVHETIREEFLKATSIPADCRFNQVVKPASRRSIEAAMKEKKLIQVKWKDFLDGGKRGTDQVSRPSDKAAARVKLKKT